MAVSNFFNKSSGNSPISETMRFLSIVFIWFALAFESLSKFPVPFGIKTSKG